MRRTNRRAMALLGLVALTITGAAVMGPDKPTLDASGQVGSGLSTNDTNSVEFESADRTVITLGDLDPPPAPMHPPAPIDPCTVVDRDDLPAEVRLAEDPVRTPQAPAAGSVGCRLQYRSGPSEVALVITITWTATPPGPPHPAGYPGAAASTFAGHPGLERAATDAHGDTVCLGLMPAGAGTAAARVTNTRYPTVHPCAMTTAVLTAIARKAP